MRRGPLLKSGAARIRAIVADLFVSSTATPYTQAYAYFAGGYLGHALVSILAVLIAEGLGLDPMFAVLGIALVAIGWKETRDFKRARGVALWRRWADLCVDASAYAWGLLIATATGPAVAAYAAGLVLSGLAATALWDALREGDNE